MISYDGWQAQHSAGKASRQLEQREDCSNILSKTTRESYKKSRPTAKFLIYAEEFRSLLTGLKQMWIYPICGGFPTESRVFQPLEMSIVVVSKQVMIFVAENLYY